MMISYLVFIPKKLPLKLPQKPHIVFIKEADIINAVANHGDTLNAEAKSPARPDFRVVSDVFEYLRMNHAAASDFQPFFSQLLHQRILKINFENRFGIAEIVRPKTNFCILAE